VKAVGISDRGIVRENNEDGFLIFQEGTVRLFAVADGMGGHLAGEIASSLALETVKAYTVENMGRLLEKTEPERYLASFLEKMLAQTNRTVLEAGGEEIGCAGMGTTLTLLMGVNGHYWFGHIGDSRAYVINREEIVHLTEDHTLVTQLVRSGQITEEETSGHPQRHILTRALGTDDDAVFDIFPQSFWPGDILLLCTDGLYSLVDNEEIRKTVLDAAEPEAALRRLVDTANERGGNDNITVVLVYF